MQPLRFGNVVCLFQIPKDQAKMLADPACRILQHSGNGDTYMVNGQEDIHTVDFLLRNREQFQNKQNTEMATRMNFVLVKFLKEKANVVIPKMDEYANSKMELI